MAKYKKLENTQYYKYANPDEIEKIFVIKPKDNRLVVIASTPNSYHKGCKMKGERNFIYIGYNSKGDAWIHNNNWDNSEIKPINSADEHWLDMKDKQNNKLETLNIPTKFIH